MSLKFSQRIGLVPIETPLQTEDIIEELRHTLWNIFYNGFFKFYKTSYGTTLFSKCIH